MSLGYSLPIGFSGANPASYSGLEFHGDTYLTVTPGGEPATLRQMTISMWVRLAPHSTATQRHLFSAWTDINNRFHFRLETNHRLEMVMVGGGSTLMDLQGNANDIVDSDWHHLVAMMDLDQGTASERAKIWIDNVELTYGFTTRPSQGTDFAALLKASTPHYLGQSGNSGDYFRGVMLDFNLVTEQALTPSSFGETIDSVWSWKDYAGTHGTYGHRLKFLDSGDLGANTAVA